MSDKASFLLELDRDLWERFKAITTKDKTLNEAIIELIKKKVEENEKPTSSN